MWIELTFWTSHFLIKEVIHSPLHTKLRTDDSLWTIWLLLKLLLDVESYEWWNIFWVVTKQIILYYARLVGKFKKSGVQLWVKLCAAIPSRYKSNGRGTVTWRLTVLGFYKKLVPEILLITLLSTVLLWSLMTFHYFCYYFYINQHNDDCANDLPPGVVRP